MRISCPCCGLRDQREYTYTAAAVMLDRPAPDAGADAWDAYLHLRDNPAGVTRDLWFHNPCGTWVEVERDTVTHEVISTRQARGQMGQAQIGGEA